MTGEICDHLEELLSAEIKDMYKRMNGNKDKHTPEMMMKYIQRYAKSYRIKYCGSECVYRTDCDLAEQYSRGE